LITYTSSSSSAHYSPLLDLSNCSPSRSTFGYSHSAPASHPSLVVTPPGLRASYIRRGLHSRTRLPQRLSVLRLIWPPHCHFSMLIRCAKSVTLVLCWIIWFRIRSRRETPSIAFSIFRWATLNLLTSRAVNIHVSALYVMTGRKHWLKTFVLRLCEIEFTKCCPTKLNSSIYLIFKVVST
jgi:hypothetical protein